MLKFIVPFLLTFCLAVPAFADARQETVADALFPAATATGTGETHRGWGNYRTFQATGFTTAGAGSAVAVIEVSNTGVTNEWIPLATITLTLATTHSTDGFSSSAPWKYVRARLTTLTGTGATAAVYMGN